MVECNCECAHHLERVLLEVISSQHTRGQGNAGQLKLVQQVVVAGTGTLALVNLDEDSGLVVRIGREHLLLLGGNRRVPRD